MDRYVFMICVFLVFALAIVGLFTFLFFNSFSLYAEFDVSYDDLSYAELSFCRYERIRGYKSDARYIVYFEEYEKPFEISTIADTRLDKEALDSLERFDKIKVYYGLSSRYDCDFEIMEMSHGQTTLLSLSDYVKTNQNNQIAGMVVCPVLILCGLIIVLWLIFSIKVAKMDPRTADVGRVRMEYVADGNVIRVCSRIGMYSLVINGKVVDRYIGIGGYKYLLSKRIRTENGKRILIEAQMGYVNMRLYYNGKLVAKKFMGFG